MFVGILNFVWGPCERLQEFEYQSLLHEPSVVKSQVHQ